MIHSKSHLGERPFICPFEKCQKSYYDRGNLRYHEKTYHAKEIKDFPYSCIHSNCNMRFRTVKEKLEHHWKNDHECDNEIKEYFQLLKTMKGIYSQLEISDDVIEEEKNFLKEKIELTKQNSGIFDKYSENLREDANQI